MDTTVSVKPKLDKSKKYMLVRYGRMGTLGLFEHNEANVPKQDMKVVVRNGEGPRARLDCRLSEPIQGRLIQIRQRAA